MSKSISRVRVYLDDKVPEYMTGIIRCGSVLSYDEQGNETDHQELINNAEFHHEHELIAYVASKLNVSKEIVEIVK